MHYHQRLCQSLVRTQVPAARRIVVLIWSGLSRNLDHHHCRGARVGLGSGTRRCDVAFRPSPLLAVSLTVRSCGRRLDTRVPTPTTNRQLARGVLESQGCRTRHGTAAATAWTTRDQHHGREPKTTSANGTSPKPATSIVVTINRLWSHCLSSAQSPGISHPYWPPSATRPAWKLRALEGVSANLAVVPDGRGNALSPFCPPAQPPPARPPPNGR